MIVTDKGLNGRLTGMQQMLTPRWGYTNKQNTQSEPPSPAPTYVLSLCFTSE